MMKKKRNVKKLAAMVLGLVVMASNMPVDVFASSTVESVESQSTIEKDGWDLEMYQDYVTSNTEDWSGCEFIIMPANGYAISTDKVVWDSFLACNNEGVTEISFYMKDLSNNTISLKETVTCKLDFTAPTGTMSVEKNVLAEVLNAVTFGLLFNESTLVSVNAEDNHSGVKTVEYFLSDVELTEETLNTVDWNMMEKNEISVANGTETICYARITDNAGNITHLSTLVQ